METQKMKTSKKRKKYVLTPEDFLNRKERQILMKTCQERSELDLLKGRTTWPVRYMLIDLALYTGLRVSEISALKIGDINLEESDPFLIVRNGKGGRKRTVYFDDKLAKHLKSFISYKRKTLKHSINEDAPLFMGNTGKHSTALTLQLSWKKAIETAGLPSRYSIHKARHTYATFLLHDTGNLRYVQQQLGHSDIAMTSLYADILPEMNGKLANQIRRD